MKKVLKLPGGLVVRISALTTMAWGSIPSGKLLFFLSAPSISTLLLSYMRSRDRPGRTQQTGIFCGKALLLTSSGAREQESKSSIAYIFRSQSAREQESKSARVLLLTSLGAREQESKRENGETPSLLRRIILCLGRVTP